jgi:Mce-associated membrane protein
MKTQPPPPAAPTPAPSERAPSDIPAPGPAVDTAKAAPAADGDVPAPAGSAAPGPAADDAETALPADLPAAGGKVPGADGRWRLPRVVRSNPRRAVAVALIAVLLLVGGGLGYAAQQLKDPGAARNHALTDTEATGRLTGDVSDALSRIFAYTPDDTQTTAQAARDLLEGAAAQQYQKLFTQIRQQVADQRLTLSTRVVRAGVVSLTGDRARLLVFLDQTAQRAGATATTAAAQLSVTAHLVGGHWRISELKAR